jgi:hypothetical protein
MDELKPCPVCKSTAWFVHKLHPLRWIFTKYFVECAVCNYCGETKIGLHRAVKAWNRRAEDGKESQTQEEK